MVEKGNTGQAPGAAAAGVPTPAAAVASTNPAPSAGQQHVPTAPASSGVGGVPNGKRSIHRDAGPAPTGASAASADGFHHNLQLPDLGAHIDAPPAYGELHDQLQLSQAGLEAGANVTTDGRVNISIVQRGRRFSDMLAPAFRSQLLDAKLPCRTKPPPYMPPGLIGAPTLPGDDAPPQLNIVIQIVGSRGDVQPFVALGKVLRDSFGHRVRLATHATFQKFVEDNGLEFFNIGGDPAELMAFMVKNPGLMPGLDALRSGEITKRRKGIEEILLGCWRSCIEAGDGMGPPPIPNNEPIESVSWPGNALTRPFVADAIIANPPSFAHIHIAEKMGIPLHMMFTMPWSPTRSFPHPLANIQATNTDEVMTNYLSYALVEMMTWQGLGDVINRFRTKVLDLEPLSLIWAPGLLTRLRVPTTYCWSPALIPKPHDWGSNIDISGFFFLNLASSYTPAPDLAAFLDAGPPPVYIGFGSIVVDDPNALTRLIFDAVSTAGVRALVSKGWGGLGADSVGIPDGVFMLGNVPHDWLFTRVACVVHHGGAGTTAAGINLGVPTLVVPFFGDQPFWGSMVYRAGAGPAPIPYKKLTAENLAAAIKEAMLPETQKRAKELGARIRSEKGTEVAAKHFHDQLQVESLRCHLSPSRTAVWRLRRTKLRMSTFAAAVLVTSGQLHYTDLKLYRAKEHTTEDQPWDPISAASSSLLADLGSITMSIADIPRDIIKTASTATHRRAGSGSGSNTPTPSAPVTPVPSHAEAAAAVPPRSREPSQHGTPANVTSPLSRGEPLTTTTSKESGGTSGPADDQASVATTATTATTAHTSSAAGGDASTEPRSERTSVSSLVYQSPTVTPATTNSTDSATATPTQSMQQQRGDDVIGAPHRTASGGAGSVLSPAESAASLLSTSPESGRHMLRIPLGRSSSKKLKKTPSDGSDGASTVTAGGAGGVTSVVSNGGGGGNGSISSGAGAAANTDRGEVSINLDSAIEAGKGVGRIVGTGIKSPMNFTLGLARGFRNAPRLYNDDTVRPIEKVTDIASGLKIAGKEFGFGFYDGLTGLVTQPLRGAEKEGAAGLIKGIGKGVGGLILKPAAGIWSLPAYTMAGVHAEVRNMFSKSVTSYILKSRIAQGLEDYYVSTVAERDEVLARWNRSRMEGDELKPFYNFKNASQSRSERSISILSSGSNSRPGSRPGTPPAMGPHQDDTDDESAVGTSGLGGASSPPPRTGWFHTHSLSFDERKKLHDKKDAWKRKQHKDQPAAKPPPDGFISLSAEDLEFERAIQASVRETSRGDVEEDARVEAAIRASVLEVRRRMAEHGSGTRTPVQQVQDARGSSSNILAPVPVHVPRHLATAGSLSTVMSAGSVENGFSAQDSGVVTMGPLASAPDPFKSSSAKEKDAAAAALLHHPAWATHDDVTDEDYQAYIAEAIQQSLREQAIAEAERRQRRDLQASLAGGGGGAVGPLGERGSVVAGARGVPTGDEHDDAVDAAELERALRESKAGAAAREQAARDEEAALARAVAESEASAAAGTTTGAGDDDEKELALVLEASRRAHAEEQALAADEEAALLELVKKRSLAEEEERRAKEAEMGIVGGGGGGAEEGGKGKGRETEEEEEGDEEMDDDLKRALALSLQTAAHKGGNGAEEGEDPDQGPSADMEVKDVPVAKTTAPAA